MMNAPARPVHPAPRALRRAAMTPTRGSTASTPQRGGPAVVRPRSSGLLSSGPEGRRRAGPRERPFPPPLKARLGKHHAPAGAWGQIHSIPGRLFSGRLRAFPGSDMVMGPLPWGCSEPFSPGHRGAPGRGRRRGPRRPRGRDRSASTSLNPRDRHLTREHVC